MPQDPERTWTHDVVVVGASADGVQNLSTLVRRLPHDLPAAVFIVLHTGPGGGSLLPEILGRAGALPVARATDGEPIRRGRIYLPAADCHLLIADGRVQTPRGPRENRFRPAIDALFRSAAAACGARVVGVVLSGLLDDGAYGLRHVVDAGGVALVQDPDEAAYPSMPLAALRLCPEASVLTVAGIADRVALLARGRLEDAPRPAFVADPGRSSGRALAAGLAAIAAGYDHQAEELEAKAPAIRRVLVRPLGEPGPADAGGLGFDDGADVSTRMEQEEREE